MVSGSTCGSLGHSRHRRGADHHSQRCHRSGRTCTQYIASGMSSQRLTVPQKTACKRDVLREREREREGREDIHHTTHIVSESWVKAWEKRSCLSPSHLPDRPQSAQDTIFSGLLVFLFPVLSPRQKSQYGLGLANSFPCRLGGGGRITGTFSSSEGGKGSPGWF